MCRESNAATRRIPLRRQHAVAERVAGHVPDTDDGEGVPAVVETSSPKWRRTDSHAPRAVMPSRLWS